MPISNTLYLLGLYSVIPIIASIAFVFNKPEVIRMSRRDLIIVVITSMMSLMACMLFNLFCYYHWNNGNAFLDQFDPDIDTLQSLKELCGFTCIITTIEPFLRKSFFAGFLCFISSIPGLLATMTTS